MNPTVKISDPVSRRFQDLWVLAINVTGTRAAAESETFDTFRQEVLPGFRFTHDAEVLAEEEVYRAYRDFFWDLNLDPTKTRPTAEALARRTLQGNSIPSINTLVDACNLAYKRWLRNDYTHAMIHVMHAHIH